MKEAFLNRMKEYLGLEYDAFIKTYDDKPTRGVRLHKISKEELQKNLDIDLEAIEYDKDGYYVNDDSKYGNSLYHHLGAMYFQEPSAMAPVNTYEFKGDERVLDLCASPGGKSSQILERIPNGILYSNEISSKRAKILFSNLERMGFTNAVVLNETVDNLEKTFKGYFDVILIDSPCSGEGMMRKDEEALNMWSDDNIKLCEARDKEIVRKAISMLKQDGVLIYSTCTFAKEENEDIVNYMISELNMELLKPKEILFKYTKEGFIKNTLRFYPHLAKGEGQFMAVLKNKNMTEETVKYKSREKKNNEIDIVNKFIKDNLEDINLNIVKRGNRYYHLISDIDLSNLNVINYGIELGEVQNNRFIPYHHMFKALGSYFKNQIVLEPTNPNIYKYLHGEEIIEEVSNGFGVIKINNLYLGGFKASQNHLKNYYPKGLRNPK